MSSRLVRLHAEAGQSPWLDNLQRSALRDGALALWIQRGVRGVTSNPTIFAKAMQHAVYDEQLAACLTAGSTVEQAYWELVIEDIVGAADLLAPVHQASGGTDGFVSVEVDPRLAHDRDATVAAGKDLWARINRANLLIKVPATVAGVSAIRQLIAEGVSVNVTLIFSLQRYREVMEAYLQGLEAHGGDLSAISSVASFFVSRVDAEIDKRLSVIGSPESATLAGQAAVANARLAYQAFTETFRGERWAALAARGASVQRPLWASTGTKNPAYPDTLYVDQLVGPDTVNTMPEATLEAFEDHGSVDRQVDSAGTVPAAEALLDRLAGLGIKLDEVTDKLEADGVASFSASFDEVLATLAGRAERSAHAGQAGPPPRS
ncbi:MAG: transaldolase [Acidimicrobiales bacterium]